MVAAGTGGNKKSGACSVLPDGFRMSKYRPDRAIHGAPRETAYRPVRRSPASPVARWTLLEIACSLARGWSTRHP